jgi:hypothetical protein
MFARATFGPRHAVSIGAASSALLLGILGAVFLFNTHREKEFWDFICANPQLWGSYVGNYFLYPAMIGGLAGSVVGWALWATLTSQRVAAFALVIAWGILGGVVGFLLAVGAIVGLSTSGNLSVGRDGSGGGGVFLVMLGTVVSGSVVGSMIGAIVGAMKARTRNQR